MNMFLIDPKTSTPSVSLTLLIISFIGVVVAGALQLAGKTETASVFLELFYANCALYFSRRFTMNGKSFDSTQSEKENT